MSTINYIDALKKRNVTFERINEYNAMSIMQKRYSFYKLSDFFPVFETYRSGPQKGQFVDLDFAQLVLLADIDLSLSKIVMDICLEVEICLKTKLIYEAESYCDSDSFFSEYYAMDREYLDRTFSPGNLDITKDEVDSNLLDRMTFYEFVSNTQFGTLERVLHAFYKKYAPVIYDAKFAPFECHLSGIRKLRNIVAHNNSLLNRLPIRQESLSLKLLAMLGKEGIAHRTLKTNMERAIISDACGLLYVYHSLCDNTSSLRDALEQFDQSCCQPCKELYGKVDILVSSYTFMKKAIPIILKST